MEKLLKLFPPIGLLGTESKYFSPKHSSEIIYSSKWYETGFLRPLAGLSCLVPRSSYIEICREFPLPRGKALNAAIKFESQSLESLYEGVALNYVMSSGNKTVVYFYIIDSVLLNDSNALLMLPVSLILMIAADSGALPVMSNKDNLIVYIDGEGIKRSLTLEDAKKNPALLHECNQATELSENSFYQQLSSGLAKLNFISLRGLLRSNNSKIKVQFKGMKMPFSIALAIFFIYLGLSSGYLLWKDEQVNGDLASLSAEISTATAVRNRTKVIEEQIFQLQGVVSKKYGNTGLLNQIANMPRNNLTLKSLKIDGNAIEIRGSAVSAREVFEYFSNLNNVARTKFFEPVYKARDGRENFGLQVVIE